MCLLYFFEIWRDVPGYEGWYEASTLGNIRSVERYIEVLSAKGKPWTKRCPSVVLKGTSIKYGYLTVTLWKNLESEQSSVHRIIARTFLGPCPEGQETRHLNGKPWCNSVFNLEYGTGVENSFDKRGHGTHKQGEDLAWSKLRTDDVMYIRDNPDKLPQSELAKMFGVHQPQISRIQAGLRWSHLT